MFRRGDGIGLGIGIPDTLQNLQGAELLTGMHAFVESVQQQSTKAAWLFRGIARHVLRLETVCGEKWAAEHKYARNAGAGPCNGVR